MADPILLKRLATKLQEASESTPKGEGFWPTLAQVVADEAARTVVTQLRGVPANPFVAVTKTLDGYRQVGRADTLAALQPVVEAYLQERGAGEVWVVEVQRVLGVA